jgi:hypothetical protein
MLVSWPLSRRAAALQACAAVRVHAGEQHGEDAGEKNAVERSGAADRGDRRAKSAHFVEIGEVGADQRAEAAGDIGKRRRLLARQQQRRWRP